MKTQVAIHLTGTAKALADLLGITPGAVSQWGDDIPEARMWQLRVIKPEWFASGAEGAPEVPAKAEAA